MELQCVLQSIKVKHFHCVVSSTRHERKFDFNPGINFNWHWNLCLFRSKRKTGLSPLNCSLRCSSARLILHNAVICLGLIDSCLGSSKVGIFHFSCAVTWESLNYCFCAIKESFVSSVRFISICTQTQSKVTPPKTDKNPRISRTLWWRRPEGKSKSRSLCCRFSCPVLSEKKKKKTKEDAAYAHAH